MSHEHVEQIICRAVLDTQYRELLFKSPDKAIAGHDLTPQETTAIKNLNREKFNGALGALEEKLSTAGYAAGAKAGPRLGPKGFDWTRIGYVPSNTN